MVAHALDFAGIVHRHNTRLVRLASARAGDCRQDFGGEGITDCD